jgi:hypothetical protein
VKTITVKRTIQLACLIFILIITGCASMKVIDTLPKDSPKGYAEFFCRNEKNYPTHKQKISLVKSKGEYLFVGKSSYKKNKGDLYKVGYIIAQTPGPHFVSTSTDTYYFNIEEDMVTPIEIWIKVSVSKIMREWGPGDETKIRVEAYPPGKPIPIAEYDKKGRFLKTR